MVSMDMKMDLTTVRFIPLMENKVPLTRESVLPKTSSSKEIEEEKLSSLQKGFRVHFLSPLKGFRVPSLCMKLSSYG